MYKCVNGSFTTPDHINQSALALAKNLWLLLHVAFVGQISPWLFNVLIFPHMHAVACYR